MKKIIFHFPKDFGNLESASSVRPYKMYKSFLENGYDVFLLAGNAKERSRKFRLLKEKNDIKKYSFCYSEPSTYPVHPILDYKIYFYLKRNKIPIGVYYRDAYWKFKDYFKKKGAKKIFLKARYRADFSVFNHTASTIFFQSDSFSKLFETKTKKEILPPAGEIKNNYFYEKKDREPLNGIYVGGVSKRYGTDILLKGFSILNKTQKANLKIICRKDEYQREVSIIKPFLREKWLSIYHKTEKELQNLYKDSDFGIIPLKIDSYNPMILPVKLFEYLSYELPVVVTNCKEVASFVKKNKIGLICDDSSKSLAGAVSEIIKNREKYEKIRENILPTLRAGNLWEDRVKKIDELLTKR